MKRRLLLILTASILAACQQVSLNEAQELVEQYNQAVSEAYRRGDAKLIDTIVGPNEGKKLTGLIGVRFDMGLTLDSHLLALEVTGVEQTKEFLRVRTRERWRYRDLKIGSGQPIGEESLDSYEMAYIFKNIEGAWKVDEIRFAAPPQVGRKTTPWGADVEVLHGGPAPAKQAEG